MHYRTFQWWERGVKCKILNHIFTQNLYYFTVTSFRSSQCRSCDYVKVTEPSGVIASYVTKDSGCGSPECPWLITVPPGQRINVTLINFKWSMPQTDSRSGIITYNVDPNRQVLATIKEISRYFMNPCFIKKLTRNVCSL